MIYSVINSPPPSTVTYNTYGTSAYSGGGTGTCTWNPSIGSPTNSTRVLILCIHSMHTNVGTGANISGVTVDGNAATKLVEVLGAASDTGLTSIFAIAYPSGTSPTIVATYGNGSFVGQGNLFVSSAYNLLSMTPVATYTNSVAASPQTFSNVNFPANGFVLGSVMFRSNTGADTISWSNLTAQADEYVPAASIAENIGIGTAMQSTGSTATVTASMSSAFLNDISGAVISMR